MAKETKRATPLNLKLLRKIRNRILRFPEAYDQHVWGGKSKKAPCGTRECLAGHALIEAGFCTPRELVANEVGNGRVRNRFRVSDEAGRLLGLDMHERCIFFAPDPESYWPEPFQRRWHESATKEEQARIAADYINLIIKAGKVTD